MNLVEIKATKPLVIFTDSHTDISAIKRLLELYPDYQFICLGDITDLFNENKDRANQDSIEFLAESKIPCLGGNHEAQLLACESGTGLLARNIVGSVDYNLTQQHIDYLRGLPRGFKLILSNATYLAYHNRAKCLWSFIPEIYSHSEFAAHYPLNSSIKAVIVGHNHKRLSIEFPEIPQKLYGVGALKYGEYAILTENGLEWKKLDKK